MGTASEAQPGCWPEPQAVPCAEPSGTTLVLADLITSPIGLVEAIADHREAQRREARAVAARNAADRLRAASRPDSAEVPGARTLSPVALAATGFPDLPMSKLPGMASPEPAAVPRPGPASDARRSRGRSR
jgi:hypothetical protein